MCSIFSGAPFIFIFVGLGVMSIPFVARKKIPGAVPGVTLNDTGDVQIGAKTFTSSAGRRATVLGLLIVSLFWNGIIALVFSTKDAGWVLTPFALVGAAFVGALVYQTLRLFNPAITIDLSSYPLRTGETVNLSYRITGRFDRIQQLTLTLQGHERVTFRQGTNTRTESKIAYSFPIFTTQTLSEMERGNLALSIPIDVMTTFKGPSNGFYWQLVCLGKIARWPNLKDKIDWIVLPAQEVA